MDAVIGIYITIASTSLIVSLIYIWHTIPHWSSLVEDDLHRQLVDASSDHTANPANKRMRSVSYQITDLLHCHPIGDDKK